MSGFILNSTKPNEQQPSMSPDLTTESFLPTKWLTEKAAAAHLQCAPITLAKDRCQKTLGIPFYKLGRHIRYKLSDLDTWLEASRNGGEQ